MCCPWTWDFRRTLDARSTTSTTSGVCDVAQGLCRSSWSSLQYFIEHVEGATRRSVVAAAAPWTRARASTREAHDV
uniref:Uncharacterized protein n=1 Tax=Zea mays TaxID=4577 RepID=C0PI94_MAIZE|nr:unknown [Zea mays]